MAVFGTLNVVKKQLTQKKFNTAFEYLEKVLKTGTLEHQRLLNLNAGAFKQEKLEGSSFALEQVYISKDRKECFFESHKQYIDVQFILEGEEIIEVINSSDLHIDLAYDEDKDVIKYKDTSNASQIKLKKGDVAVFFPEDAHMPCLKIGENVKVFKTVVKVEV